MTMTFRKSPQRNAIPTTVLTVYLFKSHAKLQQNCDPVLGALDPLRPLSNTDDASMPPASLPNSPNVLCISRSEAGRIAIAPACHAFCCFRRIPRITHMEAHTSCCVLREDAVDGSIVVRWNCIRHFLFSPLDHRIHLGPPSHRILCHIRPICTNTLCDSLLPSPHPEPTSMTL